MAETAGATQAQFVSQAERSGIQVGAAGVQVQDPLGASWRLQLGATDWRHDVHITENLRPDDAQFMVAYGAWQPRGQQGGAALTRSISGQTGWVNGGATVFEDVVNSVYDERWWFGEPWFGPSSPQVLAPVYALPSLDPLCMSTTCMRHERGTLMVDAQRISLGLRVMQAVATPVPEPSAWASLVAGLAGLAAWQVVARRRRGA